MYNYNTTRIVEGNRYRGRFLVVYMYLPLECNDTFFNYRDLNKIHYIVGFILRTVSQAYQ